MIAFEFDVNKSQSNLKKHGIDFVNFGMIPIFLKYRQKLSMNHGTYHIPFLGLLHSERFVVVGDAYPT